MTPSLPYSNPVPNSGWSGSDTSRDRALGRDKSGKTATTQTKILTLLSEAGGRGATVAEVREALADEGHHGTISGALSNLHRDGVIARLADKRDRCKIYVAPPFVYNRRTEEQGWRGSQADTS